MLKWKIIRLPQKFTQRMKVKAQERFTKEKDVCLKSRDGK